VTDNKSTKSHKHALSMYYVILMSDLFPSTTEDERDPREDIDTKRDEDIKADVPPHHEN
jgi:hypothetical protein